MIERPTTSTLRRPAPRVSTVASRVLLVDDDPHITAALRRQLRSRFLTVCADSAAEALDHVDAADEPFAVVVSDLKMPGMGGMQFLEEMSNRSPFTVRILLTGYADVDTAIDALNGGYLFRFLCKPCEQPVLIQALDDAVVQHRLVTSERELLQRTLHRSIDALLETLALANPPAFSRALRVRSIVAEMLDKMEVEDRWEAEVASMLSQLGAVTLPAATADKLHRGGMMDIDEQEMVKGIPSLALRLIADIPRLDGVRSIIEGLVTADVVADDLPLGASILRTALCFDELEASGAGLDGALEGLRVQVPLLDDAVIDVLGEIRGGGQLGSTAEISFHDLRVGMVLRSDILTADGLLLVGRGQAVSENLLARIANFEGRLDPDAMVEVRLS